MDSDSTRTFHANKNSRKICITFFTLYFSHENETLLQPLTIRNIVKWTRRKLCYRIKSFHFSHPHPMPTIKSIKMKIYPIKITFSFSENGSFISRLSQSLSVSGCFPQLFLLLSAVKGENINHFEGSHSPSRSCLRRCVESSLLHSIAWCREWVEFGWARQHDLRNFQFSHPESLFHRTKENREKIENDFI